MTEPDLKLDPDSIDFSGPSCRELRANYARYGSILLLDAEERAIILARRRERAEKAKAEE